MRDPRLAITDALQELEQSDELYGVLVSQHLYNMLEMRAAGVTSDEVPLMNRMAVAVDVSFDMPKWETIATREEWLARTANAT